MTDVSFTQIPKSLHYMWKNQRVWIATVVIFALVYWNSKDQALVSISFVLSAIASTAPFLLLSISIAAWAGATGADNLIARAFTGTPFLMVLLAAMAGGISPFCSCGVIPLVAALLSMGVPLSAVMAFWLASPVMDPSMFILTSSILGYEFAIAKTLSAIGVGISGGLAVMLLSKGGKFENPLKDGVGDGGCGGTIAREPKPVIWTFWRETSRRSKFLREAWKTTMFLTQWLVLAFLLESLLLAFVPAETVTSVLGGEGIGPIIMATLVGVPAYLNGYAALPLVGGLIEQGMAPGAGLAFLVAGGITSLPAAIAVWAIVRPRVFVFYIVMALVGAFFSGLLFQAWFSI